MTSYSDQWCGRTSVGIHELVRMLMPRAADPWKLALIQRDEKWDGHRVARLLDSLLQGYPIGTLLIFKSAESPHVLERQGDRRVVIDSSDSWQILDGQQRINALGQLFLLNRGHDGTAEKRFFLHMSHARPIGLKAGRIDERIRRYIIWLNPEEQADFFNSTGGSHEGRSYWLNLANFGSGLSDGIAAPEKCNSLEELHSIDPEFSAILPGDGAATFSKRLAALVRMWRDYQIPVQRLELGAPEDILEVYARINMEGVRTSQSDLFLAGVKTLWPRAEEGLQKIVDRVPLLNRVSALRLLARLAHYELRQDDLLPLDLNRIGKGNERGELVNLIEAKAGDDALLQNIGRIAQCLRADLGAAVRFVDDDFLDHVFAWAAVSKTPSFCSSFSAAGYLVGATLFRLGALLRFAFLRPAMKICIDAGKLDQAFPLTKILEMAKEGIEGGWTSRGRLPSPVDDEHKRDEFVNGTGWRLILCLAQEIDFQDVAAGGHEIDWDHIYAHSLRYRMKWKPAGSQKLIFHPDNSLVWRTGNLAALDHRLNRKAQADRPSVKLQRFASNGYSGIPLWPRTLFLDAKERTWLINSDSLLEEKQTEKAMECFGKYVHTRELRLWNEILAKIPTISAFCSWRQSLSTGL